MIHLSKKSVTILIVLTWLCSGCSSDKVIIDKQFLYDIETAFQEEAQTGVDKSNLYNRIWREYYYELIYLAQIGDPEAIDVSILLIGQKGYPAHMFERIEWLVKPVYENSFNGEGYDFWKLLEKKPVDMQLRVIQVFNYHQPIDWCPEECYFNTRPVLKKRYEAEYGAGVNNDME